MSRAPTQQAARSTAIAIAIAIAGAGCGAPPGPFQFRANGFALPPGTESYRCFIFNHPTGGSDDAPVGIKKVTVSQSPHVHHLVVFTDTLAETNGNRECDAMEAGWNWRYAAGVGTDPLVMPDGVAIPVRPTETIILQFHYLNVSLDEILDDSTVDIEFTAPGESFEAADLFVTGTTELEVPPQSEQFVVEATCNVPDDVAPMTAIAWFPHMHQLGRSMQIEIERGAETLLIHDDSFAFEDQPMFYPETEVQLLPGDVIKTRCIYANPGDNAVAFGERSRDEMCFNFMTVHPAPEPGQSFNCF